MTKGKLLYVVRHAQFARSEPNGDGPLTTLGRRQARYTALRLMNGRVVKLFSSDLQRSRETAEIIAAKVPGISVKPLPMLREVLPTSVPGHCVPLSKRKTGKQGIEDVLARFFTKPPRSGNVVVVCHGNLIRALVCRILRAPVTKWCQLGTSHCAITTFSFNPSGQVRLHSFNDTGHLPPDLTTSS
jgi:broad specificity phosphatase PhoE